MSHDWEDEKKMPIGSMAEASSGFNRASGADPGDCWRDCGPPKNCGRSEI